MDICNEKKFIDLNDDLYIRYKESKLESLTDSENNCWIRDKEIGRGVTGRIVKFRSTNIDFADLAIKEFADSEEENEEIKTVLFFSKNKCKNFINIGIREINNNNKLIIMEKLTGDLVDFQFSKYKNPKFLYNEIVKFLADGYKCAYKHGKYFLDIKEENIGFKVCKDSIKFSFIDFGSFTDKDSKLAISTYNINQYCWKKNFFSNETILIYGTIITLLSLRLKIINNKFYKNFSNYIYDKLEKSKNYPKTNLLAIENYKKIREKFFFYFKKEDPFIDMLFKFLYKITQKQVDLSEFFNRLDFFH